MGGGGGGDPMAILQTLPPEVLDALIQLVMQQLGGGMGGGPPDMGPGGPPPGMGGPPPGMGPPPMGPPPGM